MITVFVDPERARANPLPMYGDETYFESIHAAIANLRLAGVTGKVNIIATPEAIREYQGNG